MHNTHSHGITHVAWELARGWHTRVLGRGVDSAGQLEGVVVALIRRRLKQPARRVPARRRHPRAAVWARLQRVVCMASKPRVILAQLIAAVVRTACSLTVILVDVVLAHPVSADCIHIVAVAPHRALVNGDCTARTTRVVHAARIRIHNTAFNQNAGAFNGTN